MRVFWRALLTVSLAAVCAAGAAAQEPEKPAEYRDTFRIIRKAKTEVFPAVVFIKPVVEKYQRGEKQAEEVTGSGVLISADGEVVTNYHVVEKAVSIRCLLSDGRNRRAEILGTDKDTDLALLKLKKDGDDETFPHAGLGDSGALVEGDFVMAMGAPWGLNRSVSLGIISCPSRYVPDESEYSLWIQTDAALNPGNSGGPLVNTDGEIIGINAMATMVGGDLGFAIPAATLRRIIPRLREEGEVKRSWAGLTIQPLKDFDKNIYFDADEGFVVAGSDPNSPASDAGLRTGDRVTQVAGESITAVTDVDLPAVRSRLADLPADREAQFTVYRNGEPVTIAVTPIFKGEVEGEEFDCEKWNMTIKTINKFERPELYFLRKQGVFILGAKRPGNAASSGLRGGDIITTIDGREITTLEDAEEAYESVVDASPERTRVTVEIIRGGMKRQMVLDFSTEYDSD